jgi:hypothetical protein
MAKQMEYYKNRWQNAMQKEWEAYAACLRRGVPADGLNALHRIRRTPPPLPGKPVIQSAARGTAPRVSDLVDSYLAGRPGEAERENAQSGAHLD